MSTPVSPPNAVLAVPADPAGLGHIANYNVFNGKLSTKTVLVSFTKHKDHS